MFTKTNRLKYFIEILITKYFIDANCIYIISEPNDIIDLSISLPIISITSKNISEYFILAESIHCEIFLVNSFQILDTIEEDLKKSLDSIVRFNNRKYVLLPNKNFTKEIYYSQNLYYVVNVLIIEQRETTYVLWTHDYYNMRNLRLMFLDIYHFENKTFQLKRNLYPDKLSNQMGKTLRIGGLKPYDSANIELLLLKEYVNRHNMTQEFIILPPASWGYAYDNFTASGLRKLLLDERVDIITGFIVMDYNWYRFHDQSQSFIRMGATCLVPKPTLISSWYIFRFTFHFKVWIMYLVTFILLSFLLKVLMGGDHTQTSVYYMLAIFFQHPLRISSIEDCKIKIFISSTSILVLILNAAFSSRLSSILIKPRYMDKINNMEDLDKSKIEWGNYNDKVLMPIKDTYYSEYKDLIDRHLVLSQKEIEEKMASGHFALLIGRPLIDIRLNHQFSKEFLKSTLKRYRVMKEDLYWRYSVLMLRKNSVLLESLNKLILRAMDSGLIPYWINKLKLEYKSYLNILKTKSKLGNGNGLDLLELIDAFTLYFLGISIALCVFMYEFLSGKCYLNRFRNAPLP